MVGLLHVPSCSPPKYRAAMLGMLKKLKDALRRRGDEATIKAANATPRDVGSDHLWTVTDLVDAEARTRRRSRWSHSPTYPQSEVATVPRPCTVPKEYWSPVSRRPPSSNASHCSHFMKRGPR